MVTGNTTDGSPGVGMNNNTCNIFILPMSLSYRKEKFCIAYNVLSSEAASDVRNSI